MSNNEFTPVKAEKKKGRLRLAFASPSGGGKTYTMLQVLARFAERLDVRFCVIDTEEGSASLYADTFDFDVIELRPPYSPARYRQAIRAATAAGYTVLGIDSLSHSWEGEGGTLEMVDEEQKKTRNKQYAWAEATPEHRKLISAILSYPGHVCATMRSKQEYVQEKDDRGKIHVRKLGMRPIQREGTEYEFTVFADIDINHRLTISKTRITKLDGFNVDLLNEFTGTDLADLIMDWLESGKSPEDVFAGLVEGAGVTEAELAAFAIMHPSLPDIMDEWGAGSYEEAIRILSKFGREKFTSALEKAARESS